MAEGAAKIDWLQEQLQTALPPLNEEREVIWVPNGWGTAIYDARTNAWGRLWRWFFAVIHLFDREERWRQRLHCRVMERIYTEWIGLLETVQKAAEVFKCPCAERTPNWGKEVEPLLLFERSVSRLFPSSEEGLRRLQRVEDLFQRTIGKRSSGTKEEVHELFQEAGQAGLFLSLEKKIGVPFPEEVIVQLASSIKLEPRQERELQQWVERIPPAWRKKKPSERVGVRELHQTLQFLLHQRNLPPASVGMLERALDQRLREKGCLLFQERDEEHVNWVLHFTQEWAAQVPFDDLSLKLGERLGPTRRIALDQHLVFALDKNETEVVVFSLLNEAALRLEQLQREEKNWGLPISKRKLARDGKVALEERLFERPDEYEWKKEKQGYPERWQGLVALVQRFLKEKSTPIGLSPSKVRFDHGGNLRFFEMLPKGPLDPLLLEEFIDQSMGLKEKAYSKAMRATGLAMHPLFGLAQQALGHALKGEGALLQEAHSRLLGSDFPHTDRLLAKLERLEYEAVNWRNAYAAEIQREYENLAEEELTLNVGQRMATVLQQRGGLRLAKEALGKDVLSIVSYFKGAPLKKESLQRKKEEILQKAWEKGWSSLSSQEYKEFKEFVEAACKERGVYHLQQRREIRHFVLQKLISRV